MMKKRHFLRRMVFAALCAALTAGLMIVPSSANNLDDNLDSKAKAACKDFGLANGGEIKQGNKSGQYKLNATSPGGRDLYVIQAHTTTTCDGTIYVSLYYEGSDGKLYFTEEVDFDGATEDYLGVKDGFRAGQNNAMSILLPASKPAKRILGVYLYKNNTGTAKLNIDLLTVSKVDSNGYIKAISVDANENRFRDFQGSYVAYTIDMTTYIKNANELNTSKKNTGAIVYTQPVPEGERNAALSNYIVELVAGDDGYVNKDGKVTINYTDFLGKNHQQTIRFREGYGALQLNEHVQGADTDYNHTITSDWFQTSVREMQGLASGYVGNYWKYQDVSETCLRPYTGTGFRLVAPRNLFQNISQVNSITVSLDENDSLILQSVRLIELSYFGNDNTNYWNGGFGLERTRSWAGQVVAQSNGGPYTISGKSSVTFNANQSSEHLKLQTYARDEGPYVDNTGTGVGVTIQIADVLGAGVESYLAWLSAGHDDDKAHFNAWKRMEEKMDKAANPDARKAWYNLQIFRQEAITLTVIYKDTLGATRRVDIPLTTTYLVYLLKENQGKLTGGNWKTWISGIFQQNENVALPIRLAEYGSLLEIKLSYGSAPAGFISSDETKLDTASDPISVENICFYEGVTKSNFNSKYDKNKLACVFQTSLTPAYSYSAASAQGQQLSSGSTLSASVKDGKLTAGPPKARDYSGKYLVRIKTANIDIAETTSPVSIQLSYTDTSGIQRDTTAYSIPTLTANHYGTAYRKGNDPAPANYQYDRHMRSDCVCEFVMDIPDADSFISATLAIDGGDEWQMESIDIYSLDTLGQRYGTRSKSGDTVHVDWQRDYTGTTVASARMSVLLYANNPSRTINFTTYTEEGTPIEPELGTKTEEYLTSMPESMTYNDTKKNLGLSIVKYTYQVDVEVADVEDAGSSNYFFFQLVFEHGTSGVVLANQQLASDSFRQGMVESFQIKTTQNYGNVVSVRIICDNATSTSNVFDKLNIDNIVVTVKSNNGISKSWVVDRVGWIDITYIDEGAETSVNGLDELVDTASSNVDVLKEFAVTRQATAVDLLFCISTASTSAGNSADPLENALKGKFEATLIYRDSFGMEKTLNFDLTAKIKEYNDTDKTSWIYRPNHVDRFTLSMPDITSVISLVITRSGGQDAWVVSGVSIQQIGGLGTVYLSPALNEYIRDASNAADLATSNNSQGVNYKITGRGNTTITFTENSIDVSSQEEQDSWSATISRVPVVSGETLNIYLLPGSVIGKSYSFTPTSPAVRATVKYTTIYGGSLVQNAFVLGNLGELNGQTVLYGKNLEVSAMSSLSSLVLSSTAVSGDQPYIASAIVERCRGGVLMGTYYFNFGNFYLGNGNPEFSPSTTITPTPMHQTLRLQPAAGQSVSLTPETNDVAVALRYTSTLDPSDNKTVYQSPYVYLTDAGYTSVTTGKFLDIPFELSNVGKIVGISIATTGPIADFDNAIAYNYSGPAPGTGGTETDAGAEAAAGETAAPVTLLDTCSLPVSFAASTMATVYTAEDGRVVTPAVFRFTTSPEEAASGAGTSGTVSMTVNYADSTGAPRSMSFDDLLCYLPSGSSPVPGSTVEIPLQLSDAAYLDNIVLSAEDSWLLSSVSVELSPPDGTPSQSSTTVNNWARSAAPLTIDLLPALHGGTGEGNQIQTFTVTGRGENAQIASSATATANSGGSLLVTAYEGDVVQLTPVVTAVGNPDITWNWNAGSYEQNLILDSSNNAVFRVPDSMSPGSSATFSVSCNGDKRLAVSITIAVEKEPEPEPEPELGFLGGDPDGDSDSGDGGSETDMG